MWQAHTLPEPCRSASHMLWVQQQSSTGNAVQHCRPIDYCTCCWQPAVVQGLVLVLQKQIKKLFAGSRRRRMARRSEVWRRSMHSRRQGSPWVPQLWQ